MKKAFIGGLLIFLALSAHAEKITVGLYDPVLSARMSKKDYVLGMNVFVKELIRSEKIEGETISYDDPIKLADDFESGKINMIACDALTIVDNIPFSYLQSGIMGYKNNKIDNQTLLLISNTEDTRPFHEKLRGSITTNGDTTAELYVKTLMLQNGLSESVNWIVTKNPQQSILKLFFKKADLALVDRGSFMIAAELNPQLKTKLTILKSIPLTVGAVSFMRKGMSPVLHQQVLALGKEMNSTPRGKQLLQLFRGTYMDESSPKELENVYALKKQYETLHKNTLKQTQGK
ncbi:MAG: PhnD/SsuA/transferrin family substrate-binding protein [Sulfuricurvum sp.]|nr:PhnD/SsuA/transferrin family substrate-binding protein [Sulfuricurvum sp.]